MNKLLQIEAMLDELIYELGTDTPLGEALDKVVQMLSKIITENQRGKL